MKKLLSCGLMLLLTAIRCVTAFAADSFVDFESGDWQLNAGDRVTIYVAPDDERALANAVSLTLKGAEGRQQRIERSQDYIRRFEGRDVASQVIGLYDRLL